MYQAVINEVSTRFPMISFRKKRLSVAIHAHFDMESASEAAAVKQMIEAAISQLSREGNAKVTYSVSDL